MSAPNSPPNQQTDNGRRGRSRPSTLLFSELASDAGTPFDCPSRYDLREAVEARIVVEEMMLWLRQTHPLLARVITERDLNEDTVASVAAQLGCSPAQISRLQGRAKGILRDRFSTTDADT